MAIIKLEDFLDVGLLLDLQTLAHISGLGEIKQLNSINKAENSIMILIHLFQAGLICSMDCY